MSDLVDRLGAFDEQLTEFEDAVALIKRAVKDEAAEGLAPLEKAKLNATLAYTLNALYFGAAARRAPAAGAPGLTCIR